MKKILPLLLLTFAASRLSAAQSPATPEINAGVPRSGVPANDSPPGSSDEKLSAEDEAFLEDLGRATFRFFDEQTDPGTGLVLDRAPAVADGKKRALASVAATGFGLSALIIADSRGWLPKGEAEARAKVSLRYLRERAPTLHGFYPHFLHASHAGKLRSEISSIDTALLLAGVMSVREYFKDPALRADATAICDRVEWNWILDEKGRIRTAADGEGVFSAYAYGNYCEATLAYLLALGSPTHPIPKESWTGMRRPVFAYAGMRFVSTSAPIFVHQYPQAWFDLRGRKDAVMNYWENSVLATKAHREFCRTLGKEWAHFDGAVWGISASDSEHGYKAWGGLPRPPVPDGVAAPHKLALDGTVVPCAAGGSLPFLPKECVASLRAMKKLYGDRAWTKYGFVDAFNPATGWYDKDVLGIDAGITLLMIENLRTGLVWKTFMKAPETRVALERAGFSGMNVTEEKIGEPGAKAVSKN